MLASRKPRSTGMLASGMTAGRTRPKPLGSSNSTGHDDHLLAERAVAARAGVLAPYQGLVHLDGAAELVLPGSAHRRPEAVQHRLGGLIGAQSEQLLHLQCRDTVFGAGHVPGGGEPHGQRGPGVVADDSPTVIRRSYVRGSQMDSPA